MHLEQLTSGSWRVTVAHKGKRLRGTAPTKNDAEKLGGRLAAQLGLGLDERSTLGGLLAGHIAKHPYAHTTRDDMERVLARLPEDVKATKIAAVTTGWLVRLYDRLADEGWTPYRVVRCHELMGSAFKRAKQMDLVAENPARGAAPARPPKPEITPPTDEQVVKLIDAAGPELVTAITVASQVGLRRGELCGLKWGDIDLQTGSIRIHQAVAYTPSAGVHLKELKNKEHGLRVVSLDGETLALVREHWTRVVDARSGLGLDGPIDDLFVFSRDLGQSPWRPDFPTKKWADIRRSQGLEHVRLYDLRHYMVTSMLAAGESIATVAGRAGHDPVTMLRRYWHFVPASDREEAERHAARLAAARRG